MLLAYVRAELIVFVTYLCRTDWHGLVGNSIYYNYDMSNNGVLEHHGSDLQADYLPKVLQRKALAFLKNVTESDDESPFFM